MRQQRTTYVLNNHDQERKLDGERLVGVDGARDEVGAHVGAHDLKDRGLDIRVSQSLDVAVPHMAVPNLEGLRSAHRVSRLAATYPMEYSTERKPL